MYCFDISSINTYSHQLKFHEIKSLYTSRKIKDYITEIICFDGYVTNENNDL